MKEDDRVRHEDEAWAGYKAARRKIYDATCPLERIVLEAQIDRYLIDFLVWSENSMGWGVTRDEITKARHEYMADVSAYWE